MSNVKLAIRIRPFTERELKSEKCRPRVVKVVDDNTVTITNTKVSLSGAGDSRERIRRYYADYTFDSACSTTLPSYATQEKVFATIGREVLGSISRGCSACVLAYGQSATGKTHTMIGSESQPGLVPRLCRALADHQPFEVTVSFLEIYNERVHDLLASESVSSICHSLPRRRGNARKDLRVREHPSRGPYVQNLRRVAVHSVEALLSLVSEGTLRRQTAATRRNSTSSRSHALLEITTSRATLHLADLAGSEKASWEGCGGGRQKEGANINKSLVALSNVISALVSGGIRGKFVPYRDSALTWLLKDCFTGGATTFIIATVSPSIACYGESASTLRWSARARQLPTAKNPINASNSISKAALQAQFNQLIEELSKDHIRYIPETGRISYDINHWMLQNANNVTKHCVELKASNIGNIMNKTHPKNNASHAESTASSIASGSSDVINAMDHEKINNAINKEVDKIFGPALERTSSGGDLKVVAPLRHKRRQYRSQEVLPLDEAISCNQSHSLATILPNQSEIKNVQNNEKERTPHVSILHENQRAEIVASVTERLYSKLKRKEQVAVSKIESVVDRKIMEPLSELRICSNARQRLVELSQRAIRNKRKIGIPAYTQTRISVIRVKDQGIDVQSDLESYTIKNMRSFALYRDVGTETMSMTPRCKEIAVGPKYGSLDLRDKAMVTEVKNTVYKNSSMMTDVWPKHDRHTQTHVVPPPRRKKRGMDSQICSTESVKTFSENSSTAPVISINISQTYPTDSETPESSDDNLEQTLLNNVMTPDLLNHTADTNDKIEKQDFNIPISVNSKTVNNFSTGDDVTADILEPKENSEEFSDSEDYSLPRVALDSSAKINYSNIKDIILGRNENTYPYNIILSPPRERDPSKRIVSFKDIAVTHVTNVASRADCGLDSVGNNFGEPVNDKISIDTNYRPESINTDSTDLSKIETDSFIWKTNSTACKTLGCLRKNYMPVYKSNPRYKTAKGRLYKDSLGMETYRDDVGYCSQCPSYKFQGNSSDSGTINNDPELRSNFKHRQQFSEEKYKKAFNHKNANFERIDGKILESCSELERAVNNYDNYIASFNDKIIESDGVSARTPTEYLQHLIGLRREMIKTEGDTTDSSIYSSRR